MLHESDTDDWCLAKRLRPYEYLSQCQCSMSNSFFFIIKTKRRVKYQIKEVITCHINIEYDRFLIERWFS